MKRVSLALAAGLAACLLVLPGIASSKGKLSQCKKEVTVSFLQTGRLASGGFALTKGPTGTFSGSLTIIVKSTNHPSRKMTFSSISGAHVSFASGFTGAPDTGDHVTVKGTITEPKHGCTGTTTTTVKRIHIAS